jgi:hypothetical protein
MAMLYLPIPNTLIAMVLAAIVFKFLSEAAPPYEPACLRIGSTIHVQFATRQHQSGKRRATHTSGLGRAVGCATFSGLARAAPSYTPGSDLSFADLARRPRPHAVPHAQPHHRAPERVQRPSQHRAAPGALSGSAGSQAPPTPGLEGPSFHNSALRLLHPRAGRVPREALMRAPLRHAW